MIWGPRRDRRRQPRLRPHPPQNRAFTVALSGNRASNEAVFAGLAAFAALLHVIGIARLG